MKAIMLSIKPQFVAKILNGEKTIEIRKTMPKCDLPIDVYIYCTKDKERLVDLRDDSFYCGMSKRLNGKVVAKFTLKKVEYIEATYDEYNYGEDDYATETLTPETLYDKSCVSREQMFNYLGLKGGYAWYIKNLVIFDKPKELGEFSRYHEKKDEYSACWTCKRFGTGCMSCKITKAPQSFMFVEDLL